MASVRFFTRSKTKTSQIYARFIVGYRKEFQSKIGIIINMSDWSKEKAAPRQNSAENKKIATQLKDLDAFIIKSYNNDYSLGTEFTKKWLEKQINIFFNRNVENSELIDINLIINYLKNYIELKESIVSTKKDAIVKLNNLFDRFSQFQESKNIKYKIIDIDSKVMHEFNTFLVVKCNLMESTAARMIRGFKTVLFDAQSNGCIIHHQVKSFVTGSTNSDHKIFLSTEEIVKIKNTNIDKGTLSYARDWLIAGCYLGQRSGDLLKMTKNMISTKFDSEGNSFRFIEIIQQKTESKVVIPIHHEVELILNKYQGDFPPIFSTNPSSNIGLFNRYIKKVCALAEINEKIKGKVYNKEAQKNEILEVEKYKLVSTHICRRSFATNFYGNKLITTPQLMAITGHTTEAQFLNYIGKTADDWAMQTAKTFKEISMKNIS